MQYTFPSDVSITGIKHALLVELGIVFERAAGFADAVEIAGTTGRLTLWLLSHALLRDLGNISECIRVRFRKGIPRR
jgi:beta-N-acetylglucosaminidase